MYLLFDIGGTKMRIATSDGKTVSDPTIITTPEDFNEGMNVFRQTAQTLVGDATIEGLAGGIAGALNHEKSMLINSPNLKDWQDKPLKESLQDLFNCQVTIDNDAVAIGLGEAIHGAGKDHSIVVYYTFSTGVGGIKLVDGVIEPSEFGYESGHQIIDMNSNKACKCGGKGHLESFVSGTAIEETYHMPAEELTDESAWDTITKIISIGLTNVTVHWSPQIIVLGGAVSTRLNLELLEKYLSEHLPIFQNKTPKLAHSILGEKGGLYGALTLAQRA